MPQCAQRQRYARAQFAIGDADKFKAAAAKITDIAIGEGIIAQHAIAGRCRLGIAIKNINANTKRGCFFDQLMPVFGFPRRGGCDHAHAVDLHRAGKRFEARECGQRLFHRRFVNFTIASKARPKLYPTFFVVNGHGRTW